MSSLPRVFENIQALPLAAVLLASPLCWADEPEQFRTRPDQLHIERSDTANWDLYLSGYAYHDRDTYSAKRRGTLNEKAWGGGFGYTQRNNSGNDESYYLMGIRDSNLNPQWMAGYAYQWIFPLKSRQSEIGLGLTGLVLKREDWFDGKPFPAVLPVASIGSQRVKLLATYVPHLSRHKGKGNILLFVGRIAF
jgi:palmitoyl transferase